MIKNIILSTFILFGVLLSCTPDQSANSNNSSTTHPHDPWVFRSVLDKIPRVVTVALHDKMWLAYSTENAKLYKAWRGSVNFEGPVYNQAHGPQPTSVGDAYLKNELDIPWSLIRNNAEQTFKLDFKGYNFVEEKLSLMYQLGLDSGQKINIEESPSAQENEDGTMVLIRGFNVSGLEPGDRLIFNDHLTSTVVKEHISSDGRLEYAEVNKVKLGSREFEDVSIQLIFDADGNSELKSRFYDASIEDPNIEKVVFSKDTPSGAILISKHGCRTCHNKLVKTIGPAYKSVAERYADTEENKRMLLEKIKLGGTGKWGSQVMTPHPEVPDADIKDMIDYILSLGDPEGVENLIETELPSISAEEVDEEKLLQGAVVTVFDFPGTNKALPNDFDNMKPVQAGILGNFDNINGPDFTQLDEHFAIQAMGYFYAEKAGKYNFRIWSDDGSKVYLKDQLILDHDGPHGISMKETKLALQQGYYPFEIHYFQGIGGKFLSFNYKREGDDSWKVIPENLIFHHSKDHQLIGDLILPMAHTSNLAGDRAALADVHPSFDLFQARPNDFEPKVGGMDFMSDGSLIISTWDPEGAVYRISNLKASDPEQIRVDKIASGLAEPLGVSVVDDEIYVMQKQELTQLIDKDGDGITDVYKTLCDDWGVTANFHEFGFGLEYKDGYFYAALATAIEPGGASASPQNQDRGKAIKVNKETGDIEFIAHGLRTPNGIGVGYKGELFVSDNEGDWLPSSKILHLKEGAWFGSRSVSMEKTVGLSESKPVVWLPQDEIGNSPSTPSYINKGPYADQMIHGEVTNGGIKRVFVEEVEGKLQGCVFRFSQGFEAGINRLRWSPDGELYIGGIGNSGNWQHNSKKWFGLQRLVYNEQPCFEMLAVRARSNGLEIEFTEAIDSFETLGPDHFEIKRWWYKPTEEYGGPKMDEVSLEIKSVSMDSSRTSVFIELDKLKANHVYYVRISDKFISINDNSLWTTEAWYTMNEVPANSPGIVVKDDLVTGPNKLTSFEEDRGWQLLFDGQSMEHWRNYNKESLGTSWIIDKGSIHLNSQQNTDGSWSAPDGGDILTKETYKDFELKLEWRISNCGNSGIMFNVKEDEKYCCPWSTGPEMQVLDNSCHPDSKYPTHRAGDLYDMLETSLKTVNPAGEWNKVRIRSLRGDVDFWLNGYKVVSFNIKNPKWKEMISESKFADMEGFGSYEEGHISLQDHSDKVWYRNIKIRKL